MEYEVSHIYGICGNGKIKFLQIRNKPYSKYEILKGVVRNE